MPTWRRSGAREATGQGKGFSEWLEMTDVHRPLVDAVIDPTHKQKRSVSIGDVKGARRDRGRVQGERE